MSPSAVQLRLNIRSSRAGTRTARRTSDQLFRAMERETSGWGGFSTNPSPGGHVNLGDDDAWLAKYISGGLLLGTISFATTVGDVITDLTVGADGAAYVVGTTPGLAGRSKRGPYGYGQR
jgi:hypothetical protein